MYSRYIGPDVKFYPIPNQKAGTSRHSDTSGSQMFELGKLLSFLPDGVDVGDIILILILLLLYIDSKDDEFLIMLLTVSSSIIQN